MTSLQATYIQQPMQLAKLAKPFMDKKVYQDFEGQFADRAVSGIQIDSRKLNAGDAFIAYPGHASDGRDYIEQALNAQVSVIFAESYALQQILTKHNLDVLENTTQLLDDNQQAFAPIQMIKNGATIVPVIAIDDLAQKVSAIAARFYHNPTKKMSVVGVTGTNGKTSCCYLIAQALEFLQHKTLMLSTIGNGNVTKDSDTSSDLAGLQSTANTTPDAVSIQQLAAQYLAQHNNYLAMEVSSHGLQQGRVNAVRYKVAVFTNLSLDHLDYHGDMESYFQAKRQLFLSEKLQAAVINADDEYGRRLLNDEEIKCKKIAISTKQKNPELAVQDWVLASDAEFTMNGISASLQTPWGNGRLHSSLLGDFNLSNLLAVAAVLGALIGDINKWMIALNAAKSVPGRMHKFQAANKATVVVDYAHTPDALEKALQTLRHHTDGNLWCIFGCGGERDNSKRALMGKVAEVHADSVIITNDNPRNEDAETIVDMIRQGMSDKDIPYIAKRAQAIKFAIEQAQANDMILVAGKGHEDYQQIGNEKIYYSDLQTVQQLMEVAA